MLATTKNEELETKLNDKSTAFNNNTMWPIAKVITTTNLINNYNVKVGKQQDDRENDGNNKKRKQV